MIIRINLVELYFLFIHLETIEALSHILVNFILKALLPLRINLDSWLHRYWLLVKFLLVLDYFLFYFWLFRLIFFYYSSNFTLKFVKFLKLLFQLFLYFIVLVIDIGNV